MPKSIRFEVGYPDESILNSTKYDVKYGFETLKITKANLPVFIPFNNLLLNPIK